MKMDPPQPQGSVGSSRPVLRGLQHRRLTHAPGQQRRGHDQDHGASQQDCFQAPQ